MYHKSGKGAGTTTGREDKERKKKEQEEAKQDMIKKLGLSPETIKKFANAASKRPKPVSDPTKPRKRQGF